MTNTTQYRIVRIDSLSACYGNTFRRIELAQVGAEDVNETRAYYRSQIEQGGGDWIEVEEI